MPTVPTTLDDLEHLQDASFVNSPTALRARPLGHVAQENFLIVDRYLQLDRPLLVGPGTWTATVGHPSRVHHRRFHPFRVVHGTNSWTVALPHDCPVVYGSLQHVAAVTGKGHP